MSAQKIRAALGQLQDDPDIEDSWNELFEAVTAPDAGMPKGELRTLLESARRGHETRREWDAVAKLLELEAGFYAGTPVEFAMQFELARLFEDELFDDQRATAAYQRLLEIRPSDPTSEEALERSESKRKKWKELVQRYLEEAAQATDAAFKSSLLMSASEVAYRYGERSKKTLGEIAARLEEALKLDPKNGRVANLLERIYRSQENWQKVARLLETRASDAPTKEERALTLNRFGRVLSRKLEADDRAVAAYVRVLDVWPGNAEAMSFLSEHFSKTEQWDHLVALYEDQLRGGGAKSGEEAGIVFQIAMVNWKMRKKPELAEPYFDRLRRFEPSHSGMLGFFREFCTAANDRARLLTILTDAQRSLADGPEKTTLATEIARLAEAGANAQKAIDQYKTILRHDPTNTEARQSLKRLYTQTEGWNALIELLRQDLERTPAEDKRSRLRVLREIASVYRDRIKSDTALVTVLAQIVQLDNGDIDSLRELVRVYEALGRWRDLLQHQSALAALLPRGEEKTGLFRAVARRWLEQFSNVQNATEAFEASWRRHLATKRRWPGSKSSIPSGEPGLPSTHCSRGKRMRQPEQRAESCFTRWPSSPPSGWTGVPMPPAFTRRSSTKTRPASMSSICWSARPTATRILRRWHGHSSGAFPRQTTTPRVWPCCKSSAACTPTGSPTRRGPPGLGDGYSRSSRGTRRRSACCAIRASPTTTSTPSKSSTHPRTTGKGSPRFCPPRPIGRRIPRSR